jgi:hypothetical protein
MKPATVEASAQVCWAGRVNQTALPQVTDQLRYAVVSNTPLLFWRIVIASSKRALDRLVPVDLPHA